MEEIEVKFLNIDKPALEEKLHRLGTKKVGEYFYRRYVFDYPDLRLNTAHSWIRLRDEGDRITLGFKQRLGAGKKGENDQGMKEIEIVVNDFERTRTLLHQLGLIDKFYQENRRTRYVLDGVEFDIDEWPRLPPYLEIEAPTWEKIDEAIAWLDLDPAEKKIFSTNQIYKLNGINELDYTHMGFDSFVERIK